MFLLINNDIFVINKALQKRKASLNDLYKNKYKKKF